MGFASDMVVPGLCCAVCGIWLDNDPDDPPGRPVHCEDCLEPDAPEAPHMEQNWTPAEKRALMKRKGSLRDRHDAHIWARVGHPGLLSPAVSRRQQMTDMLARMTGDPPGSTARTKRSRRRARC